MSYAIQREKALAANRLACQASDQHIQRAITRYAPSDGVARTLTAVTSGHRISGYMPLSTSKLRRRVASATISELLRLYARTGPDANVRHFLLTGSFDDGIVSEKAPAIPLARIKRKVRRLLQQLGLNAVCTFEIDVLAKPLAGETTRLLLVHVHAVVWTTHAKFKPRKSGRELSDTRALRNRLGSRSIDFTSRARSDRQWPNYVRARPQRDQTADSMAWLGYYLTKPTTAAKRRRTKPSGRTYLRPDARYFRLKTALRFAEIWSQLELKDVLFGVGDGDELARRIRKRVGEWTRHQRGRHLEAAAVAKAWKRLFADNPQLGFASTIIER